MQGHKDGGQHCIGVEIVPFCYDATAARTAVEALDSEARRNARARLLPMSKIRPRTDERLHRHAPTNDKCLDIPADIAFIGDADRCFADCPTLDASWHGFDQRRGLISLLISRQRQRPQSEIDAALRDGPTRE